MTHDPEAAERLVAILTPLITEQSCGEWDDKTINEDVQKFLPPLLAALQEARNAALREAANIVRGEVYLKHYRTWVIWPPYDDLPQERPNVSENHRKARHCDQLADAILTLIDTPAPPPPAPPAGDAQPITMTYRNWCGETGERTILPRKLWFGSTEWHPEPGWLLTAWDCDKEAERVFSLADCQFAALAAAPDPQPDDGLEICPDCMGSGYAGHPDGNVGCYRCRGQGGIAPQPDADEREALVRVVEATGPIYSTVDPETVVDPETIADALLAAGWTRKREADALIEAERRGAERMRERAAVKSRELWADYEAEESPDYIANGIRALPLTEETTDADA